MIYQDRAVISVMELPDPVIILETQDIIRMQMTYQQQVNAVQPLVDCLGRVDFQSILELRNCYPPVCHHLPDPHSGLFF